MGKTNNYDHDNIKKNPPEQVDLSGPKYARITERLSLTNNGLTIIEQRKFPEYCTFVVLDKNRIDPKYISPDCLPNFLTHLSLTENELSGEINMSAFKVLDELWVDSNKITIFVGPQICKIFHINNNLLESLPKLSWQYVVTLDISGNKLTELILASKTLKKLDASNNSITYVSIDGCLNLKKLNLDDNELEKVNLELRFLERLSMANNSINEFDLKCPSMKIVNFKNNKIPVLSIQGVIEEADVSGNEIEKFTKLSKHLKILIAGNNVFQNFPDNLPENLEKLDLSDTFITDIVPESVPLSLTELVMTGCEILGIPQVLKNRNMSIRTNTYIQAYDKALKPLVPPKSKFASHFYDFGDDDDYYADFDPDWYEKYYGSAPTTRYNYSYSPKESGTRFILGPVIVV